MPPACPRCPTYTGSAVAATVTSSPVTFPASEVAVTYNGSATLPINAGTYAVVATLTDPNYAASLATGSLVIGKAAATLLWATPAAITYGTPLSAAQLDATVTGSIPGTIAYSQTLGTVLPAGSTTLIATFTPTDTTDYATATATVNLTVNSASTTTALSSSTSNGPAVFGQSVTFTAQVAPTTPGAPTPGGAVTFFDGTTTLGTGTLSAGAATFTTATLSVASHSITAAYAGNSSNAGSTSSAFTQVVKQASTTTTLLASSSTSTSGTAITFTATVATVAPGTGTPTGSVTFLNGTSSLGTLTLNAGVASFTTTSLAMGSQTLTAVYAGDSNHVTSTSTAITVTVNKAATTTALLSSVSPSTYGQSVTFTATVTTAGSVASGTVTFKDGTTTLCTATLSGGAASFNSASLSVGSHALSAIYGGDATHTGSTSATFTQTVTKATPTSSLTSSKATSTYGQTVTFTATVPPGYTGIVTFLDGTTVLGTANSGGNCDGNALTATFTTQALTAGSHAITATFSATGNDNAFTTLVFTQTVTQATPNPTLTTCNSPGTYGQPVTFTATVAAGAQGLVTFLDGTNTLGTSSLNAAGTATFTTSALSAATHSIHATHTGDLNFTNTTASLTVVVNKANPVVTWGNPAAITLGTALGAAQLDATANVTGTFTYTPPAGTVLAAGSGQTLKATFTPADALDYATATRTVTLNVTLPAQTITFGALAPMAMGSAPFTLGATASSGLPVSYASSNPSVATVKGNLVTLVGPGATLFTASQSGNAAFAPAANVAQGFTVTPKIVPPTLHVSALGPNAVTPGLLANFCGQATSPIGIASITVNNVAIPFDATGYFSCPVELEAGSNSITTVATDKNGLTASDARNVTLDTTAPVLTLTAPAENTATCNPSYLFKGSIATGSPQETVASVTYTLNGGPVCNAVVSGSQFQFTNATSLTPGLNTVEITGRTSANRVVMEKRTVIEQPGFTLAITSPAEDLITTGSSITVSGTVANNCTPVTVVLTINGKTFTPAVAANGTFSQLLSLPGQACYTLTVQGTDLNNEVITVERNIIRAATVAPATVTTPEP